MTYVLTAILLIWIARLHKGWQNYRSLKVPKRGPLPAQLAEQAPLISICVPARNEEESLAHSLPRFLGQDYPNYEVLVVNDRSDDGTSRLLSQFSNHPRLRVLEGTEPPSGKVGKCWALDQAQNAARGEYLCFSDADIDYEADTLSSAVRAREESNADLIVYLPRMRMETFAERLLMPCFSYVLLFSTPIYQINRDQRPSNGHGNGVLMLVGRRAYHAVGGHAALLDEVVDDITLSQRIVQAGFRQRIYDASDLVSLRMYAGFRGVWEGLSKNLGSKTHRPLYKTITAVVALFVLNLLPLFVLIYVLFRPNGVHAALAGGSLLLLLGSDAWIRRKQHVSAAYALLRPLAVTILAAITIRSIVLHLRGAVMWRGRLLKPEAPSRCGPADKPPRMPASTSEWVE